MTSHPRSPSPVGSTTGSLSGKLAKLSISNTNMSTSGRPTTSHDEVKLKDDVRVEFFHGERAKLRAYLMQVKLVHALNPSKYSSESNKVMIAATYLRGDAQSWFEPYFSKQLDGDDDPETIRIFKSFDYYEEKLKQVFGNVDEERVAARMLRQLRQKGSAAQYYSRFQQLSARVEWDDTALASAYYEGLSEAVKDQMGPNPPAKFKALVDSSIRTDGWLFERRMEKKGGYSGPRFSNQGRKRDYRYGDPMDLDAMDSGRPSRPRAQGSRGHGGNKERERRRRENLCYNCGKSGHRAMECNSKPERLHMMNDNTSGMIEKKADTIMKPEETLEGPGTAQRQEFGETPREENAPDSGALAKALDGTSIATKMDVKDAYEQAPLNPQDIDWDAFAKEVKRKAPLDHAALSWTACFNNFCPIHRSDKEGSGWFPQGPKNKNKKKRTPPSWWEPQQEGESTDSLIPQETLNMMEAHEEGPPPYEGQYEVVQQHEAAVIIRTRHFIVQGTSPRRVLDYWPTSRGANSEELVVLRTCYDPACPRRERHSHDVQGWDFINTEPSQLCMMNELSTEDDLDDLTPSKTEEEGDAPKDPGMDDESDASEWEQDPIKFVAIETTTTFMIIVTNYWRPLECTKEDCGETAYHRHPIFDPEISPQEYVRKIRIDFCQNKECRYSDRIHAHQGSDTEPTEVSIPMEVARTIWPDKGEQLNMIVEHIGIVEMLRDERANAEYIAESFECQDIECGMYFSRHKHLFNVDPDYPKLRIRPNLMRRMIDEGKVCYRQECEWRQYLHVHFAKNY